MAKQKVELGDVVKDKITGFVGVVISRTEWLNGCVRFMVQPEKLKDGKPRDAETFDLQQLEVVKIAKVKPPEAHPGGPRPDPKRLANPKGF